MLKSQEILNEITSTKEELAKCVDGEGKVISNKRDEALEIRNKIEDLQKDYEAQKAIEDLQKQDFENKIEEGSVLDMDKNIENKTNLGLALAKAIAGNATPDEVKALMQEDLKEKGGVVVPKDVETKIIELQRKSFDIRKYINVEPVGTNKGSRPIEANEPKASGFASIDEGAAIQELHEPEFTDLEYIIRKYAGYIPLTTELLEDSPENILGYIQKWMAKNELNTYNYQVFNGTGSKAAQGIMKATELDEVKEEVDFTTTPTVAMKKIKGVLNKELEDLDSDNIVIFTNADGYDFLDNLEDKNGHSYLQPDATKSSGYAFLGKEVVKVPSKFLENVVKKEGTANVIKTPFIIGDLKLLYTMFDRKQMSIESTTLGGMAWREDKTEVKGIFRFDGRLVDTKAVKILLAKLA